MDIDILCKVVDNYGDIGFAYRLARSLSERPDPPRLRMIVDDLAAFALLDPLVDPSLAQQVVHGWELFRWREGAGVATAAFRARKPTILLECFACGRPDWLDAILFDPSASAAAEAEADSEKCLIVDVEHLTAEPYADDFHRMPSLTRSPRVRKAIFLPGFTAATGGLLVDESFARTRVRASTAAGLRALRRELLGRIDSEPANSLPLEERFWVCVFGYERDYRRVVADLAAYQAGTLARGTSPLLVLAASGKSQGCLAGAWEDAGKPFSLVLLPFLPQETWDALLLSADFSIIRGEDSWARASLGGKPFVWQAYPQDGRHHMVKVAAFLDRLCPRSAAASAAACGALRDAYVALNDRDRDSLRESGTEALLPLLERYRELVPVFGAFSASLGQAPDLASGLLTFLGEIV